MSAPLPSPMPASAISTRGVIVLLALLLLVVDFWAGPDLGFPVFYVFPVMVAAWWQGFRLAAPLAVGMTLARFLFHWWWDFPDGIGTTAINNLLRCGALLLVAVLTELTARQNRLLRERVSKLERLLPLCESCDTVRAENGEWRTLDAAAAQTPPRPRCPACAEKEERL